MLSSWQVSADQLQLSVNGVSDEIAGNVRAFLSIASLEDQSITSESRLRFLHRRAMDEIREALEPFGFYNPEIKTELNQLSDGNWQAIYTITPGPQVMLTQVNIQLLGEGKTDPFFNEIVETTPLKTGSALDHQAYNRLKNRLQSVAAERGYYRARFQRSSIFVNRDDNSAEINVTFATGQRTRISEIRFSESPISEDLLRRYPRFTEGDFLDVTQLIDLQSALIDSNYFADVEVLPLLNELEEGEIPLQISLTPRPRTLYRAGIGFGTDTGARVQLGMDRRYVNSRGHRLNTNLRLSQIRNDISGSYMIPGTDPRSDQYGIRGRYSDENSDTIESQTYSVGGIWQKQIGDWERVLTLDLEQEQFTFDDDTQNVLLLIPRAKFSKTVADDLFNTRKGHSLGFSVAATSDSLVSDISLLQLTLNGKRVDPLGDNWRLLSRFELGATYTESFEKVPASMRFYAGGDNSVRGYDFQNLGPTSAKGNVIGGQYLMVGSVEADYMFRPDWRMAAFMDAGNAFDDFSEPVKTSVGVGVRWQSPVGPIRLDLAKPIEDSGFRIHFTLGPDL
ncbi:autotransporter assembly complex protein TamA [Nitrincola schmidtii]|uniref:autotransporter assembly complex protein TamA n=1 Tax=Nitrincola schmidtii TaxID=1730894 RepID=UPI00124D5EA8|nr:autotransporter assembly complex family protein [Nitrincola schmidtii]